MSTADIEALAEQPGAFEEPEEQEIAGASPFRIAMQRLRRDKVAVVCAAIIFVLIVLGVFAPVISNLWGVCYNGAPGCPQNYEVLSSDGYPAVGPPFNGFTWAHPLGLEPNTGYDNLARLLYGLRTSLAIATLATVLTTVMGIAIGLVAGFARGWVDRVISFVIDLFLAFPFLLGALALAPILTSRFSQDIDKLGKAQIIGLVTVLVVFTWMGLARLIRGEVLSLREREFVQAAQVMGVPTHRILIKELLPNLTAPIIVATSLALPAFVAAEAGLSYLGIGLTSVPSLGRTIFAAVNYFENYPLYLWSPVILVMLLVVALNLLGDSIRDAFDPKTRR